MDWTLAPDDALLDSHQRAAFGVFYERHERSILGFFGAVTQTHRHLFEEAIGGQISPTSLKCMELLRQQLPHIPPAIVNQRLMFLWFSATSVLIAREEGLAAGGPQRMVGIGF